MAANIVVTSVGRIVWDANGIRSRPLFYYSVSLHDVEQHFAKRGIEYALLDNAIPV